MVLTLAGVVYRLVPRTLSLSLSLSHYLWASVRHGSSSWPLLFLLYSLLLARPICVGPFWTRSCIGRCVGQGCVGWGWADGSRKAISLSWRRSGRARCGRGAVDEQGREGRESVGEEGHVRLHRGDGVPGRRLAREKRAGLSQAPTTPNHVGGRVASHPRQPSIRRGVAGFCNTPHGTAALAAAAAAAARCRRRRRVVAVAGGGGGGDNSSSISNSNRKQPTPLPVSPVSPSLNRAVARPGADGFPVQPGPCSDSAHIVRTDCCVAGPP